MKKEIIERLSIPEGVEVEINKHDIIVKFQGKEIRRSFSNRNITVTKKDNEIILESKKATKRELKNIGTSKAHIKNMFKGMKENFVYQLEAAYVHFPMTVEIDKANKIVIIKNFLGEKKPRICEIIPDANVSINKNIITVESHNKETAGQMSANLEKATKVRNKDLRKFQDGIYITKKCGVPI